MKTKQTSKSHMFCVVAYQLLPGSSIDFAYRYRKLGYVVTSDADGDARFSKKLIISELARKCCEILTQKVDEAVQAEYQYCDLTEFSKRKTSATTATNKRRKTSTTNDDNLQNVKKFAGLLKIWHDKTQMYNVLVAKKCTQWCPDTGLMFKLEKIDINTNHDVFSWWNWDFVDLFERHQRSAEQVKYDKYDISNMVSHYSFN